MEEHSMGYLFFAAKVVNATFSNILDAQNLE
jgi:hypothetical protein